MTLKELHDVLKTTGFPVAYSHFEQRVKTPFICYNPESSNNLIADNKTYQKIDNVMIELYTNHKNVDAEGVLELQLDKNDLPFETDETYIDDENLFEKTYHIGVIYNG